MQLLSFNDASGSYMASGLKTSNHIFFYWRNSQHIYSCVVFLFFHRMKITETLKMVIVFYYQLLNIYCTCFISYSAYVNVRCYCFSRFLREIIKTANITREVEEKQSKKTLNLCFCYIRLLFIARFCQALLKVRSAFL